MARFDQRHWIGAALGIALLGGALSAGAFSAEAPAAGAGAEPPPSREAIEFFERKIRPVLAEQCAACHRSGQKNPMGGLALDSRAALLRGGQRGPAIVPGDPEKSLLLRALHYRDPSLQMPPKGKLPEATIAAFAEWVKMGAPWPGDAAPAGARPAAAPAGIDFAKGREHWAFRPLRSVPLPAVRRKDWPRTPVDYFLLARLEAAGLEPAPPADRLTLLRRVTFDLTGLPPTPEEIRDFLADTSPNAYEKVVERLLASPHYGERWGRHWLDLMRFAETDGHEYDLEKPNAWRYRDYVIRAFNADVPYDRFVMEHIAGDLLPDPRRHPTEGFNESIIGTGSFFLGEGKHSPVDLLEDQSERVDNQIDVFSKSFLALTVSCARCHDHKFDPISAKDYYALTGILKSSRYAQVPIDAPERFEPHVRRLEEIGAALRPALAAQAVAAQQQLAARLDEALSLAARPEQGRVLPAAQGAEPSEEAMLRALTEGAAKEPSDPFHPLAVLLREPAEKFVAARDALRSRLEAAAARRDGAEVFERFDGSTFDGWETSGFAFGRGPRRELRVVTEGERLRSLLPAGVADSGALSDRLQGALRSRSFKITKKKVLYRMAGRGAQVNLIIDNFHRIREPVYGGLTIRLDNPSLAWYEQDVSLWVGHEAYFEILDHGSGFIAVDEIRFSEEGLSEVNPRVLRILRDPAVNTPAALAEAYRRLIRETAAALAAGRAEPADVAMAEAMLRRWPEAAAVREGGNAELARLLAEKRETEDRLPEPSRVMAFMEGTPRDDRVHLRGSHKTLGDAVPRRFLEVLAGPDQTSPKQGSGRLELARRVVAHPLTARVMVNRIWQHHFGEGLVRTPDDFGVRGERPSHPELLEWLAGEFIRSGWSIKHMHRLMVLSAAYRMASHGSEAAERADPQNRLLHRMPVRRLEAEAIRDAILTVSGRLDRTMFGPGVLPHLTPFMEGRGRPDRSGPLDGDGRRSIYINVRRNFLTPMFLAFDYPIPFSTVGKRSVSTVPAQALTLMNNPFVVEQAKVWAKRVLATPAGTGERVRGMYLAAFGRPPTPVELREALDFLAAREREYGANDPRAWADLAHVLFNVKEFIFVH